VITRCMDKSPSARGGKSDLNVHPHYRRPCACTLPIASVSLSSSGRSPFLPDDTRTREFKVEQGAHFGRCVGPDVRRAGERACEGGCGS
jgi:hypothetical protein